MLEKFTISEHKVRARLIFILTVVAAVIADQVSKWAAMRYLTDNLQLIPNLLWLEVVKNSGIAFSMPIPNIFMLIVTPIILVSIWFIMRKHLNDKISIISLGLIIGGGSGNYIDRILSGAVTDFIATSFWPTFNVADTLLVCGAFLLIIFHGKIQQGSSLA